MKKIVLAMLIICLAMMACNKLEERRSLARQTRTCEVLVLTATSELPLCVATCSVISKNGYGSVVSETMVPVSCGWHEKTINVSNTLPSTPAATSIRSQTPSEAENRF